MVRTNETTLSKFIKDMKKQKEPIDINSLMKDFADSGSSLTIRYYVHLIAIIFDFLMYMVILELLDNISFVGITVESNTTLYYIIWLMVYVTVLFLIINPLRLVPRGWDFLEYFGLALPLSSQIWVILRFALSVIIVVQYFIGTHFLLWNVMLILSTFLYVIVVWLDYGSLIKMYRKLSGKI